MVAGVTGSPIVLLVLSDGVSVPGGSVAGRVATELCHSLSSLVENSRSIVLPRSFDGVWSSSFTTSI